MVGAAAHHGEEELLASESPTALLGDIFYFSHPVHQLGWHHRTQTNTSSGLVPKFPPQGQEKAWVPHFQATMGAIEVVTNTRQKKQKGDGFSCDYYEDRASDVALSGAKKIRASVAPVREARRAHRGQEAAHFVDGFADGEKDSDSDSDSVLAFSEARKPVSEAHSNGVCFGLLEMPADRQDQDGFEMVSKKSVLR